MFQEFILCLKLKVTIKCLDFSNFFSQKVLTKYTIDSKIYFVVTPAPLAQLVEQLTLNQWAHGSSP